ncbi:MAG: hypothetical protein AB2A00_40885 [Myxococcota bacterium]
MTTQPSMPTPESSGSPAPAPALEKRQLISSVHDVEDELVDRIFALPFEAQLGLLRTLAPRIIACLDDEQRHGFRRDLEKDILRATRGESTYDIRHTRH